MSQKGKYRYGFPRDIRHKTEIVSFPLEDHTSLIKLCLKRALGNEYINNFNDVVMTLFRTNQDVRFMIGSSEETFYAMKYATKPQKDYE